MEANRTVGLVEPHIVWEEPCVRGLQQQLGQRRLPAVCVVEVLAVDQHVGCLTELDDAGPDQGARWIQCKPGGR